MSIDWRTWRLLALCSAVAPIAFAEAVTVGTMLTADYSSIRQTISELASPGMPHPAVVNAGFAAYGVLVLPLAPLLRRVIGPGTAGALAFGLVCVYGAGAVLAAVFTDRSLVPMLGLEENTWHDVSARMGFGAILALTLYVPYALRGQPSWRTWRTFSLTMAVMTIAFAAPFQARWWPDAHGLLQRAFFATTMLWVGVTALRLLWLVRAAPQTTEPAT